MLKATIGAILLFQLPAMATLIVVPPSGSTTTVFDLPGNAWNVSTAITQGTQFTISGTSYAYYHNSEYPVGWGVAWGPGGSQFDYITPNGAAHTITINLGGTYDSVGGFFAYERYEPAIIVALDKDMNILQSYSLPDLAPITPLFNNDGAFRGVDSTTQNIHYLRITGKILMHSITLGSGTLDATGGGGEDPGGDAPEPATLGCVLLAVSLMAAKRLRKTA
jgi:hypothetical protein